MEKVSWERITCLGKGTSRKLDTFSEPAGIVRKKKKKIAQSFRMMHQHETSTGFKGPGRQGL